VKYLTIKKAGEDMYIKDKIRKHILMVITVILCIFGVSPSIFSSEPNEPSESIDYFGMDIEELMEVEVVSASRQPT
jgi:hypothetical protein